MMNYTNIKANQNERRITALNEKVIQLENLLEKALDRIQRLETPTLTQNPMVGQ